MTRKHRELTADEVQALSDFAARYGRTWKQELRFAWMDASEPGILQQLRNDPAFGPAGLNAFRFPEIGR
jgi:uncharacterized protein YbjT (DUF2867 family)